MAEDDSDDDLPISEIRKRKAKPVDDSDDDVPIAQLVQKKPAAKPPANDVKTNAKRKKPPVEDSDDDVPIKDLRKRRKQDDDVGKRKKPPVQEDEDEDDEDSSDSSEEDSDSDVPIKKTSAKKKTPAKTPAKAPAKKTKKSAAESVFYETQRGRLVQALLRRWWYAIDWPSEAARTKVPEEHFEVLPGFPGVHICTSGSRLGEIVDHRDHTGSPCFNNLYKKPTKELKALVATAIDKQIAQLADVDADHPMIKSLKSDAKDLSRIQPDKADSEAKKAVQVYDAATKGRRAVGHTLLS